MTTEELLRRVRARGATFQVLEESRLKVQAPSPLPDAMMEDLRLHKAAILDLLAGEPPANALARANQGETANLLAWAAGAAEAGLTLQEPILFLETPLRLYTTTEVGRYCRDRLKFLSMAQSNRVTGGWGRFPQEWWTEMESEAIAALAALKSATDEATEENGNGDETECTKLPRFTLNTAHR